MQRLKRKRRGMTSRFEHEGTQIAHVPPPSLLPFILRARLELQTKLSELVEVCRRVGIALEGASEVAKVAKAARGIVV